MIERCGDRQRKFDGLQKWPFHLFVESLPLMLQAALLLLACGLCRQVASINTPVAGVLITLTALGVLFYLVIVVAGVLSYACPFQTPASSALRCLWKKTQPHVDLLVRPIVTPGAYIFRVLSSSIRVPLWKKIIRSIGFAVHYSKNCIIRMALNFNEWICITLRSQRNVHHSSPAVSLGQIRQDSRVSPKPNSSLYGNNPSTHGDGFSSPQVTPTPTPGNTEPWLAREGLITIQETNAKDVQCVSWILRNITDPEALDAVIHFAGTIWWFEDGIGVEPPYSIIVSTFHTCFDSTGTVYPGLSDRAYHSARAILWIHILAMCEAEEFAHSFPLPHSGNKISYNSDLNSLLGMHNIIQTPGVSPYTSIFTEYNTPGHMQWASHALLHFCWTKQGDSDTFPVIPFRKIPDVPWNTIPLDATLNLFLAWSIFLGCPIQEEALKIQDKT